MYHIGSTTRVLFLALLVCVLSGYMFFCVISLFNEPQAPGLELGTIGNFSECENKRHMSSTYSSLLLKQESLSNNSNIV